MLSYVQRCPTNIKTAERLHQPSCLRNLLVLDQPEVHFLPQHKGQGDQQVDDIAQQQREALESILLA